MLIYREGHFLNSITALLGKIRMRLWWREVLKSATTGMMVGLVAATILSLMRWVIFRSVPGMEWTLPLLAAAVAAIWATGRKVTLQDAAKWIDHHYGMKDRALTALTFVQTAENDSAASDANLNVAEQLQVRDAIMHCRKIRPAECLPVISPSPFRESLLVLYLLIAAGLVYWGGSPRSAKASAYPAASGDQVALLRSTVLEEFKQLASEDTGTDLEPVAEKLETLLGELETEVNDQADWFAKLSEIEETLQEAEESLQISAEDEAVTEALADALSDTSATEPAAEAFREQDYEKAADALENAAEQSLQPAEKKSLAEKLKALEQEFAQQQSNSLQQASEELREGLEQQDPGKTESAMKKMASASRQQAAKQQQAAAMAAQMEQVAAAKNQGNGNRPGDSTDKSDRSSTMWGRGTAGDPDKGPETAMQSERRKEELTVSVGEGASVTEKVRGTADQELATREYAEQFQRFQQQAEAVLEREDLPVGHRRTIQDYFRRIRPTTEDSP
ncbi:hypothetical protein FF011L_20460 [Roseimaritima multifibrata]|uniref:Chromosome partition protein Smc n=1 Tax=Roseimaritima multifibrata TaxID=1930274 RepID=A0A517MEG4_9BACT|nr:magnesium transporter [Roseimaritima multifibrata]QDS93284.1 hypothetical protein FF011L_20460 [Roseimaritima multifibrata]